MMDCYIFMKPQERSYGFCFPELGVIDNDFKHKGIGEFGFSGEAMDVYGFINYNSSQHLYLDHVCS